MRLRLFISGTNSVSAGPVALAAWSTVLALGGAYSRGLNPYLAGVALEVATALPRAEEWLAAIALILYEGAEAGVNMLICAL